MEATMLDDDGTERFEDSDLWSRILQYAEEGNRADLIAGLTEAIESSDYEMEPIVEKLLVESLDLAYGRYISEAAHRLSLIEQPKFSDLDECRSAYRKAMREKKRAAPTPELAL